MLLKDIKLIFHEKRFYLFPLLLIIITCVAIAFGKGKEASIKINLGVADLDNSEYSAMLLSYFKENEVFSSYINIFEAEKSELEQEFLKGNIDLYLIIPEGFTENLININNTPITAVINSSDTTKAVLYKNLLESYGRYISSVEVNCQALYDLMRTEGYSREDINSENVAVSYDLIFTALGKDDFFKVEYIDRPGGIALVNYYVYSAMILLALYIGAFAGLSMLKERLSKVNMRLQTIGFNRFGTYFSKAAAYTFTASAILVFVIIIINLFADFDFSLSSVLFLILSIFIGSFIFIGISSFFKSEEAYIVFTNMFILLLTIVGGGIIPIMYLPEILIKIARFTPNYWFIRALL